MIDPSIKYYRMNLKCLKIYIVFKLLCTILHVLIVPRMLVQFGVSWFETWSGTTLIVSWYCGKWPWNFSSTNQPKEIWHHIEFTHCFMAFEFYLIILSCHKNYTKWLTINLVFDNTLFFLIIFWFCNQANWIFVMKWDVKY